MKVTQGDIKLLPINIERDALFAHSWFTRAEGRDTLLRMGNAEHEIIPSTLDGERATMHEFIDLEARAGQTNHAVKKLNNKLGFVADGDEYTDENDLEWQNVKMN